MRIEMDNLYENIRKLSPSELDKILDKRDTKPFDKAWCETNNAIPLAKYPFSAKDIFLTLSKITIGHEICSYISDDLELLNRAKEAGIETDFLKYIRQCYENGVIPSEWHC